MDPIIIAAIAVAILVVGFIVFMKVSKAIMKLGFLIVSAIVLFVLFKDKIPM